MNQSFGGSCRCDCGYAAPKLGAQFWLLHQRRWLVISQIQKSRPGWPKIMPGLADPALTKGRSASPTQ
jgi:hypothetical protein